MLSMELRVLFHTNYVGDVCQHQSRDVWHTVGYAWLEFMGQVQFGDRSFNTRLLGILKGIRQNTIIKRLSVDQEGGVGKET